MFRCRTTDRHGRRCCRRWHFGLHQFVSTFVRCDVEFEAAHVPSLFPVVVRERAHGRCEAAWTLIDAGEWVCAPAQHPGEIAHAFDPADLAAGIYDPDRAVWLCATASRWVAAHPDLAEIVGLTGPPNPTAA